MTNWKCPKCGRTFARADQSHYCEKPQSMDEYIRQQDEAVREKLQAVRAVIHAAIPDAEERISWSMPTFWKGRNILHFAASKKHLGVYPGDEATAVFAEKLKDFDVSKGTVRIPWSAPMPEELLGEMAQWCYERYRK